MTDCLDSGMQNLVFQRHSMLALEPLNSGWKIIRRVENPDSTVFMVKRLTLRQLVERVARRGRLAGFVICVVALAHLQSGPRGVMLKQFQDF